MLLLSNTNIWHPWEAHQQCHFNIKLIVAFLRFEYGCYAICTWTYRKFKRKWCTKSENFSTLPCWNCFWVEYRCSLSHTGSLPPLLLCCGCAKRTWQCTDPLPAEMSCWLQLQTLLAIWRDVGDACGVFLPHHIVMSELCTVLTFKWPVFAYANACKKMLCLQTVKFSAS